MDTLLQLAQTRRSTRDFTTEQISDSDLSYIIEAGRWAPSGANVQYTRLLVIQDPKILEDLRVETEAILAGMTYNPDTMFQTLEHSIAQAKKGQLHFFYHAPVLVVACNKKEHPNAIADTSCVMENMMLAAAEKEIGSCWINQLRWLNNETRLVDHLIKLGMAKDETVYASLALGYGKARKEGNLPRVGNPVVYL